MLRVASVPLSTSSHMERAGSTHTSGSKAATMGEQIESLQKQYDDLTAQFHGFSSPSANNTLTSPNDPALAEDFAHAASTTAPSSGQPAAKKSVRFSEAPRDLEAQLDEDPNAARLFPYRDDPDASPGYRDRAEGEDMSNVQIHAYHQQILEEQDAQLDALGASISRQRELSMQIGDELDSQVAMLDEGERLVDRHQGRLDRARRQVGRIGARCRGEQADDNHHRVDRHFDLPDCGAEVKRLSSCLIASCVRIVSELSLKGQIIWLRTCWVV